MAKKLLLLGAGLTNSLNVYNITREILKRNPAALEIHVWEKASAVGGRFFTLPNPFDETSSVDLGAQYLTWSGQSNTKSYFKYLEESGIARKFDTKGLQGFKHDDTRENFVCPKGTSSVVRHFLQESSDVKLCLKHEVRKIEKVQREDSSLYKVYASNGNVMEFDIVVSTVPVPQLLEIDGITSLVQDAEMLRLLNEVRYTTRFAVGLFFNNSVTDPDNVQPVNFVDDPIIRYYSFENLKRVPNEVSPTGKRACSLLVHTSTTFGADYANTNLTDVAHSKISEVITEIIPFLKKNTPGSTKYHRWKYSQVQRSYQGTPGYAELSGNFIATGDGFTKSGIEGCISASEATTKLLTSRI